jgi:DNA repair protein RadC
MDTWSFAPRWQRVRVILTAEPGTTSPVVREPGDLLAFFQTQLGGGVQESFWAASLDVHRQVAAVWEVALGTLTQVTVDPAAVFRPALLLPTTGLIVGHNHPSGSVLPSTADRTLTAHLAAVGRLLQIPLVDHLIVSETGHYSLAAAEPDVFEEAGTVPLSSCQEEGLWLPCAR